MLQRHHRTQFGSGAREDLPAPSQRPLAFRSPHAHTTVHVAGPELSRCVSGQAINLVHQCRLQARIVQWFQMDPVMLDTGAADASALRDQDPALWNIQQERTAHHIHTVDHLTVHGIQDDHLRTDLQPEQTVLVVDHPADRPVRQRSSDDGRHVER